MDIQELLSLKVNEALQQLHGVSSDAIEFQATRKEFEGDITIVVFPLLRLVKTNPVQLGEAIGNHLVDNVQEVKAFNVVKGFLNLVIDDSYYLNFFNSIKNNADYGKGIIAEGSEAIMVEYSSPNTNKPLHLGHVRNNLLGYSVAEIIKASGKKVYKTQIINDRGIHICKSMLAWRDYAPEGVDGEKETPTTTKNTDLRKGDKFVGHYYVQFEKELRTQAQPIFEDYRNNDFSNYPTVSASNIKAINNQIFNLQERKAKEFNNLDLSNVEKLGSEYIDRLRIVVDNSLLIKSIPAFLLSQVDIDDKESIENKNKKFEQFLKPVIAIEKKIEDEVAKITKISRDRTDLMGNAKEMLREWEAGNEEVVALWKKMNQWVYDGFEVTYKNLGVDFDSYYYESNTYLLGKDNIEEGLEKGVFYKKEDGSVWCDLTEDGLDEKLVLRSDGTAVYMTQDIGTAIQRIKDNPDVGGMIYTVGNEQDYHFKVLFLILKKLGYQWAEHLYHLSYGMVDLPTGKMKSREGTVVDADDLMVEMTNTAREIALELGKLDGYSKEEKEEIYSIIGMGALKYHILKVDPKRRILFDPKESVDFNGNSGPFIMMSYVRTRSILRSVDFKIDNDVSSMELDLKEKNLIKTLQAFPETIQVAAQNQSPALIANYTYDLVKEYNSFYQSLSILGESDENIKVFRVQLSKKVGEVVKDAFKLLGIEVPERM